MNLTERWDRSVDDTAGSLLYSEVPYVIVFHNTYLICGFEVIIAF